MEEITELLHGGLMDVCELLALLVEMWGTVLLVIVLVRAVKTAIDKKFNFGEIEEDTNLNKGLSVVIEICMASELLHSIISTELRGLLTVFVLVLLRVFMTYALHWEGKQKEHHKADHAMHNKEANTKEIK